MKKIVFIHLYNDFSGAPKVLSDVIKIIKKKRIKYDILTSKNYFGFLSQFKNIKNVFYKRSNNKFFTLFFYLYTQVLLFLICIKYKNQNVLFYINTMQPCGGALAGKLIDKKVIYHIHETSFYSELYKFMLKKIINLTASTVIYVSTYLKFKEKFKIRNVVIDNFVKNQKKNKNIYKKKFNILMICSLKQYKGVYEFFKIAKELENYKKIDFNLVLNADNKEISKFFGDFKITNNVKIYSKQKNTKKFYKYAKIVLNLSDEKKWIETSGLTILEAMSFGVPTIGPRIGGPNNIIINDVNGYKISSKNILKISKTIINLYSNRKLHSKISKNSYLTSKKYNYQKFEKNLLKTLKEFL